MSTEKLFQIRFLAKAERLSLVRVLVKEMAESVGCCVELSEKLVIAVNEACMNIIQHAYKGDESGEIVFEMLNNEKELHFRLVDYACPIDLNSVKPRDLNDIRPGGLGTHFITEIMDEHSMGHLNEGEGNYLNMKKKIN
tara:strand:- start:1240 stop:1656 length:417 start_codon:yes stop_codon:yes gene_type:complete